MKKASFQILLFFFASSVMAEQCLETNHIAEPEVAEKTVREIMAAEEKESRKNLDEELVVAAGKSGVYNFVSLENRDLLEKSLLSFREQGMSPEEITEELRRSLKECKGN